MFEARIVGPTEGLDFTNGYQIEVTATGADGSSATSGMAAIAGGGMPPGGVPQTGGGGASGREPMPYVIAAAAVLTFALGGVAFRRLIFR